MLFCLIHGTDAAQVAMGQVQWNEVLSLLSGAPEEGQQGGGNGCINPGEGQVTAKFRARFGLKRP